MLYLFYGADTRTSRAKLHALVETLLKKQSAATVVRLNDENFDLARAEESLIGQGLFAERYLVVLDNLLVCDDAKEFIMENMKTMGASENIFFVLEEKIDARTRAKIEKVAAKIQEYTLTGSGAERKDNYNVWALADAIGERNRKKAWVLLQEAFMRGAVPEEVHGMVYWQVKNIALVKGTEGGAQPEGMKPFVFNKTQRFARNYSSDEILRLSRSCNDLYHCAHGGEIDFAMGLEKLVLTL